MSLLQEKLCRSNTRAHACVQPKLGYHYPSVKLYNLSRCSLHNELGRARRSVSASSATSRKVATSAAVYDRVSLPQSPVSARDLTIAVIGSGIGGLAMAAALSSVARVIVIERCERSELWDGDLQGIAEHPAARLGVLQYNQMHVMLNRGLGIAAELFPGFEAEAARYNAPSADAFSDGSLSTIYGAFKTFEDVPSLPLTLASRHFYEQTMRKCVEANPRVTFRYGARVSGLVKHSEKELISGVRLTSGAEINADFVIDAAGRRSEMPKWLGGLGYAPPPEDFVDAGVGYLSRWYKLGPRGKARMGNFKTLYNMAVYPQEKSSIILQQENGLTCVLAIGFQSRFPPHSEKDLEHFMEGDVYADAREVISDAEPVTHGIRYLKPVSYRRHYDRTPMPAGLLCAADSLCNFTPVYGQGMTIALIQAQRLRDVVTNLLQNQESESTVSMAGQQAAALHAATPALQRELASVLGIPWLLATSSDLGYPSCRTNMVFQKPPAVRAVNAAVMAALLYAAARDRDVQVAFVRFWHMVSGPEVLIQPNVLLKVLVLSVKGLLSGGLARPANLRSSETAQEFEGKMVQKEKASANAPV